MAGEALISLESTSMQMYGLVFLLGSLTVATLSDVRRMAAQQDFAEVWAVVAVTAFVYDGVRVAFGEWAAGPYAAKWLLILAIAAALQARWLPFLRVSAMDVAAIVAVSAMLPWALVVAYLGLVVVGGVVAKPMLVRFGSRQAYPFLPVVSAASVAIAVVVFAQEAGIQAIRFTI